MDVAKYIAKLHEVGQQTALEALKRSASAPADANYYLGWHCGFQIGLGQAEQALSDMLNEEQEKEKAE